MGNPTDLARKACALLLIACVAAPGAAFAKCGDPFALRAETGQFDFKQTRKLSNMKTPLVSTGIGQVKPGRIEWRVMKPTDVRLTITPGQITQSVQGGPAQAVGPASADPFLRSSGLFEILTGDYGALRRYYTITSTATPAGNPWKLSLKPKDATLARFLTTIEIAGCTRAENVNIRQANGDTIGIEMSAVRKG